MNAQPYPGYGPYNPGPQYQPAPPYTERQYCGPPNQMPAVQYVQATTTYAQPLPQVTPQVTEVVVMDGHHHHHHHHGSELGTALAGVAVGMALEEALDW